MIKISQSVYDRIERQELCVFTYKRVLDAHKIRRLFNL